jgi:hypothetical protein
VLQAAAGHLDVVEYLINGSATGACATACCGVYRASRDSRTPSAAASASAAPASATKYTVKKDKVELDLMVPSDVARANGFEEVAHVLEASAEGTTDLCTARSTTNQPSLNPSLVLCCCRLPDVWEQQLLFHQLTPALR